MYLIYVERRYIVPALLSVRPTDLPERKFDSQTEFYFMLSLDDGGTDHIFKSELTKEGDYKFDLLIFFKLFCRYMFTQPSSNQALWNS